MDYRDWYCVQVAAGCEKKARASLLARKDELNDVFIKEVEVPESSKLVVNKAGKRRVSRSKLLPGYIIVQVRKDRIEQEDGTFNEVFPAYTQEIINGTFRVLGFANMDKKLPLPMRAKEVKNIFDRVDDTHLEVKTNVELSFEEGDIVDVMSGPFAGYKAEVVSLQGDKVLGQLDMFGRVVPAEFSKAQLYKNT
jgi:transcriptional antiterminator NusG